MVSAAPHAADAKKRLMGSCTSAARRGRHAAAQFFRKLLKRQGRSVGIVKDAGKLVKSRPQDEFKLFFRAAPPDGHSPPD